MVCPTVIDAVIVSTLPRAPRTIFCGAAVLPSARAHAAPGAVVWHDFISSQKFHSERCGAQDLSPPSLMCPGRLDALEEA